MVRVTLDDHDLVVKRYNMKNIWHRLRRCLRTTRAYTAWRLAQKSRLFGVRTNKPVAYLEKICLGLTGKSYYVTEYVSGENAGDYINKHLHEDEKISLLVQRTASLLKNLAKLEISHGDLKITNILIDQHEQPVLIDFDGALEHESLTSLETAWRKEIKRFMQNFADQPKIREKFKNELNK